MRVTVTLLVLIISALLGLIAVLGGNLWSLQPGCAGCGANIGAGILALLGWVWLGLSVVAIVVVAVWAAVRKVRRGGSGADEARGRPAQL